MVEVNTEINTDIQNKGKKTGKIYGSNKTDVRKTKDSQ